MRAAPVLLLIALSNACATAPPLPVPREITWEEKLGWIMRLEDQRILREPFTPPPVILAPATRNRPAIVAPPPPSDVVRLLRDQEARVRRRAALAAGRIGLVEAVEPLVRLLIDPEMEVRQMAAFALGLIGDPSARPALQTALRDPEPTVQGRAAEALGLIGDPADAVTVAAMVQTHIRAGVLSSLAPDDLSYPLTPQIEAVRLGLYALARLGSFDALASVALDPNGQPVSRWWPVAYALQRIGDAKAAAPLLALLDTEGRFTAAFAARGLGVLKASTAVAPLIRIVQHRRAHPAVVMQAARALVAIADARAVALMLGMAVDTKTDPALRLEALAGVASLRPEGGVDVLLDLLSDSRSSLRAAAATTLARTDPETFLTALSGLDPDRDWTVRAAQASALASLSAGQASPRLMAMLRDSDQRVIPSVLNALVALRAAGTEAILLERLAAEDVVVRATASTGLGELKSASAFQPLATAYRNWQSDATYVARAAALSAITRLNPEAARPILQEALNDRDWAVRVRAGTLLRESRGAGDSADANRPAPSGRTITEQEWQWLAAPPFSPHAYIETDRGLVELELAVLDAPLTVANFIHLARRGFFNGMAIHRVVPDFVVQDGDPRGDGEGGPGYTIRDEINQRPYLRGTVGMALDWEDTGGSQFFITHSPQPHLDGRYTVFGYVVNGMDLVDQIQQWDVIRSVRIWDGVSMTP